MRRRIIAGSIAALASCALGSSGPARATTCTPGPYIVFFASGIAQVDTDGLEILDNAVHSAGACRPVSATIAGFTDTRENPRLARDRVEVARAYFLAHGFPPRDIAIKVSGTKPQRIATGDHVSELQNRRVEITFGPPVPMPDK